MKTKSKKTKKPPPVSSTLELEQQEEALRLLGPTADLDACHDFAESFWVRRTGRNASQETRRFLSYSGQEEEEEEKEDDADAEDPLFSTLLGLAPAAESSSSVLVWLSLLQLGHEWVLELKRDPEHGTLLARPWSAWVKDPGDEEDPHFAFSPDHRRVVARAVSNRRRGNEWAARTGLRCWSTAQAPSTSMPSARAQRSADPGDRRPSALLRFPNSRGTELR